MSREESRASSGSGRCDARPRPAVEIVSLEARRLFSAYQISDLGLLSGYADATATGLNDHGHVVGFAGTADPYYEIANARAFVNYGQRMRAVSGRGSIATGINDWGRVVGADLMAGVVHPFVSAPAEGTFTDLTAAITGPFLDDGQIPIPHAINNAGQIAGETIYAYYGDQIAWVYSLAAADEPLRNVAGDSNSAALAINDSGVSAGYTGNILYNRAFRDSNGDTEDLGVLPAARAWATSRALGINDAGQTVGDSSASSDGAIVHAFVTTGGSLRDLGTLPGRSDSTATDINNQGIICGQSGDRAFVFRNGKMTDLNSLIPAVKGLVLTSAVAINDNGQLAVNGTINGHSRAFLLTPTDHATVSGRAFNDANGDGVQQTSEALLRGRQVYVDANANAKYDAGEQTTFTDAAGRYALKGLSAGTCRISQVCPSGWRAVAVAARTSTTLRSSADITVSVLSTISGINFANRRV
jgi:probable HAF family extracellular repeat protein